MEDNDAHLTSGIEHKPRLASTASAFFERQPIPLFFISAGDGAAEEQQGAPGKALEAPAPLAAC